MESTLVNYTPGLTCVYPSDRPFPVWDTGQLFTDETPDASEGSLHMDWKPLTRYLGGPRAMICVVKDTEDVLTFPATVSQACLHPPAFPPSAVRPPLAPPRVPQVLVARHLIRCRNNAQRTA